MLDLGCGGGFSSAALRKLLGARTCVVGADISLDMLRTRDAAQPWLPLCCSMASLPLRRPVFDAVVSISAIRTLPF